MDSESHSAIISTLQEQINQKENPTLVVKNTVELSLRSVLNPYDELSLRMSDRDKKELFEDYLPNLSVHGSNLRAEQGEENNDYFSMCDALSQIVSAALTRENVQHTWSPHVSHAYLIVPQKHDNVIVDPSLGQLVKGYNRIFVGTPEELKELITKSYENGNLINLDFYSSEDMGTLSKNYTLEEVLTKFWGIKS